MGRARLWSLDPSPGLPWARSQAGSGPGPRPGSPGLGPRLQVPYPAYVSALLAIYVCDYSTLIYVISFRKTTNYSKLGARKNASNKVLELLELSTLQYGRTLWDKPDDKCSTFHHCRSETRGRRASGHEGLVARAS